MTLSWPLKKMGNIHLYHSKHFEFKFAVENCFEQDPSLKLLEISP